MKKFLRSYLIAYPFVFLMIVGVGIVRSIWMEFRAGKPFTSASWGVFWEQLQGHDVLIFCVAFALVIDLQIHFAELKEALGIHRAGRHEKLLSEVLCGAIAIMACLTILLSVFWRLLLDHYSEYLPAWLQR